MKNRGEFTPELVRTINYTSQRESVYKYALMKRTKLASNAWFSKSRKKSDWEKRQQKIVRSIDHFFEEWETQDKEAWHELRLAI